MGLLDTYGGELPDLLPDVGQQKQPDPAEQFKGSIRTAQYFNPDELASDFSIGKKVNLAPDFVAADRQMARQKVVEDDASRLFSGAPIARDFLSKKPTTLALTQDDLFNVVALEKLLTRSSQKDPDPVNQMTGLEWMWESAKRAIQVGDQQNQIAYLQLQPQTAEVKEKIEVLKATMPKEPATKNWDELGLDLRSIKDALEMGWVEAMKMTPQRWEQLKSVGFYGAGGYIAGGIAGGLATGGLGIVPGAKAGLAVGTGYGAYITSQKLEGGTAITEMDDFRDEDGKPLDPALKQMVGEGIGIINGGLELFQIKTALRAIPGGNKVLSFFTTDAVKAALKNQTVRAALTQVAKLYGTTVAKETAQELGQEFVTVMGGELAKMASDGEFAKITPDQFWQRMADTAYSSATAFMVMTAPGSSIQVVKDVKAARQAQLDANFFQALDDNVQASKLRERLPEAHAELVEAIRAEGGTPEAVYVEASKLREATGLEGTTFNQLLNDIGVDPEEFARAEQLQADVAIPFKEYASRVAGTELSQKLREDVKFSMDGMSQRQAKEFEQTYQTRLQAAMAEQQANQQQHDAELERVVGEYKGELKRLGMSDADADASLQPLIKGASVAAARWTAIRGETVTPAQWLTEVRNLQVRAVDQQAGVEGGGLFSPSSTFTAKEGTRTTFKEGNTITITDRYGDTSELSYTIKNDGANRYRLSRTLDGKTQTLGDDGLWYDDDKPMPMSVTPEWFLSAEEAQRAAEEEAKGMGWKGQGVQREDGSLHQDHPAMAGVDMNNPAQVADAQKQWAEKGVESPYFKKWFGDSKVVDAQGKPLVVYHGTASDITEFQNGKATDKEGRKLELGWGKGKFYFTESKYAAGLAADWAAQSPDRPGKRPGVMPVYLRISNPIDARMYMTRVRELQAEGLSRDAALAKVDKQVKAEGHDGILDKESGGIAVFDPTQIKSVFNRGTFDASDPRILMQGDMRVNAAGAEQGQVAEAQRLWAEMGVESPYFKKWFGDSKVVDAQGQPLVVYHGTKAKKAIDVFRPGKETDGMYFSDSVDVPRSYSGKGKYAKTYAVYLSFKQPLILDAKGGKWSDLRNAVTEDGTWTAEKLFGYAASHTAGLAAAVRKSGFDSIIIKNVYDYGPHPAGKVKPSTVYIALDPTQIKSVFNRGTFDAGDPRILYQTDEDRAWADWQPERTNGGKIKGAPEWVQNDKDLATMRRTLRKFVQEGLVGRMWYENSAEAVVRMVGGDLKNAEKFIQLLAIYSPNSNVLVNTIQAVKAYTHWASGGTRETFKVGSGVADAKAVSVLYHDEAWSGRKTNSFYMNLMHDIVQKYPDAVKELNIDQDIINSANKPATIDVWMARAFGYEVEQFADDKGTGQYSFAENEVRRLTARLNMNLAPGQTPWTPHQVQAAVWTAVKSRYEIKEVKDKTNIRSEKQGLITRDESGNRVYPQNAEKRRKHLANWRHFAMQVTSEQVIETANENARSFGDDLQRMTNVVTWEANPSTAFGYDINKASPEVLRAFTAEARALLIDEHGNDLLAYQLGVPLSYSVNGFGAYASAVSPNNLSHLLPARKTGQEGFSVEEVRAYARAIQYIFKQDAVPWFRPDNKPLTAVKALEDQKFRVVNKATGKVFPGGKFETQAEAEEFAKKKGENAEVRGGTLARGMVLRYNKALDPDALQSNLEALKRYLGEDAGFTRTADNEITVVNFRDDETKLPFARTDEEFIDAVEWFVGEHRDAFGITDLARNWVEGEYGYVHDWKADPEGTVPLEGAAGGRPVLHSWLRGRRDAFNALLEQYSGERLARLEQGRTLFQHGPAGDRLRAGSLEVAARYGAPGEGSASVLGVHYSQQPRVSLSGRFYGTGIKGEEFKRLAHYPDDRIKQRVHFYVDTGSGIKPEPGVGPAVHAIHLDNLYDVGGDPLGIKAQVAASAVSDADFMNALESAVVDAGFDGVYVPKGMGDMGVAVLLGPAHTDVKVQQLKPGEGMGETAAPAQQAAPKAPELSARVLDDKIIYTDMDSGRVVAQATLDGKIDLRDGQEGKGFEDVIQRDLAGRSLLQPMDQVPQGTRGAITFYDTSTLIRLFKGNANFSTMLHETAHLFVNDMEQMISTGKAPQQVIADLEAMRKYAGKLDTVEGQEKLARAFEAYLREGKAPSAELRSAFRRFRAWLTAIYRSVRAELGVELNDEIRGVFDRMLAAEDEINRAESSYATDDKVVFEMLTPAEQKRITELKGRSHEDALEKRTQRYVSAYLKALGGKKALETQARAEIEAMPIYKTINAIADEGGLPMYELDERFGQQTRLDLAQKFPGLVALKEGSIFGIHDLDTLAVAHGYKDGDALIADLRQTKAKGEMAREMTAQKIAAEEANARQQLSDETADEDVHNGSMLEKLVLEAKALERKIAQTAEAKALLNRGLNTVAMRDVARGVLEQMTVAEAMRYDRHSAAERRAGIEAERAIKKGKWEEALAAKEREAMNHALVLEAVKLREQVAKYVKVVTREARAKSTDFEAKEQILALAEAYKLGPNLKPMKPEELTTVTEYLNKVYGDDELGMSPVGFFSPWVLNRENAGSFRNLTVAQMNELAALVSALADAGGSEYARMASDQQMSRQDQVDKMVAAVHDSGYQTTMHDKGTTKQRATSAFRGVMASLQKMPDLFRNADGNVDAGPKQAHIMGPNQEFAERLHTGTRKALEILYGHKELQEIEAAKVEFARRFRQQFGERVAEIYGIPVPAVRQEEGMRTWTAESVWCVALNMGNEGNLRTLLQGDGLGMDALVKLTSILNEKEWKAIQATWDMLGGHYSETDKVFRKVYGFPMPNKVQPLELKVRTAEGKDLTLPGGYFPIKVDRDVNPDIGTKQDQDLIKGDPNNKFAASIARGHTKERLGTSRPVSLSYEVAHRALLDQARFIALAPIIKDAQAIYTNKEYRRAMIDAFGREAYEEIMPWLKNIANPVIERRDHFDNALSKMRHLSTLYILGLNLKSATKQYLGLAGTANKLGMRWTASGLTEMAKFGGLGVDFVNENSAYMRNREEGLNPELAEINAKARGKEFRLFGIKTGLSKKQVVDAVMVLTRLTDRHVTYSTWLGAYKKAQAELGMTHQESVDFADRMVRRTQMSGSAVDTTGWQRKEGAARLLTMFMSEAIPKSSRMRSDFNSYKQGHMTATQYARSLFFESIAPAIGYTALIGLMGGLSPKDWWKDLWWQLYSETFGLFPLLGGLQSAIEWNKPIASTPSLEALDIAANVVKASAKLKDDHSSEGKARLYKALVDAMAYSHGVGNLRRIYETAAAGWDDIDHNKTMNPFRLFIKKPKE